MAITYTPDTLDQYHHYKQTPTQPLAIFVYSDQTGQEDLI